MKRTRAVLALLCLLAAPAFPAVQRSAWEWDEVSRVVILGDVHGSYDKLVALLRGTEIVDGELNWSGGDQHLVFCGDLTDRGSNDRGVMDLARRLQAEAEAAGGRVHVVLGNHEVMNLTRDRRYWNADLLDEFAEDETEEERKEGMRMFRRAQQGQGAGEREAFAEKFPPGYFARARAFEPDGEYGAWLLEQPTVVKINGVLFVHGGLTRRMAKLGLDGINRRVTEGIRSFIAAADELGNAASFPRDLGEIMFAAEDPGGTRAARAVLDANKGVAFDSAGPLWYRGTSVENERLERARVKEVLDLLDARAEVVGHTVTRSGRISSRFNNTVYRIDVGMGYGQPPLAAILEDGEVRVFDPRMGVLTGPYVEPMQGEGWPAGEEDLADHVLERFLLKAKIESVTELDLDGVPAKLLDLELKDMRLRAVYGWGRETAEEAAAAGRVGRRRYQHQVAAYKLDRALGLDMVPVSVLRKVKGTEGVVQIWIQSAVDLVQMQEYHDFSAVSGLDAEIARARAFSALIGLDHRDRLRQGKMVLPVSKRVMVADNGIAFVEDPAVAPFLPEGCGPVGSAFLHDLAKLETATLRRDLGQLLSPAQIEALAQRRDDLLAACGENNADWTVQKVIEMQPRPPG